MLPGRVQQPTTALHADCERCHSGFWGEHHSQYEVITDPTPLLLSHCPKQTQPSSPLCLIILFISCSFRQAWKIQNCGEESWPEGCYLKVLSVNGENVDTLACINHIQASNNNLSDFERINLVESMISVPALRPGNHTVCSVVVHSPAQCGPFQTKFRLCTQNGNYFGDTLWAIVPVTEAGTLALTQQVNDLHTSSQVSMVEGPANVMDGGMQLVEANSEFLFNRPQNSPEAAMIDNGAVVVLGQGGGGSAATLEGTAASAGGSAMDADLIPTNFN